MPCIFFILPILCTETSSQETFWLQKIARSKYAISDYRKQLRQLKKRPHRSIEYQFMPTAQNSISVMLTTNPRQNYALNYPQVVVPRLIKGKKFSSLVITNKEALHQRSNQDGIEPQKSSLVRKHTTSRSMYGV